ncbi:HTH-type transcriptional repressor KstR2 [termite gut metagenome]|uniref:HTH-type transcriptional repressor KstR2 n=1 Tax=termite gut metagenome TaxID=433724 RepID=A0A5J4S5N9_9ZZZZ
MKQSKKYGDMMDTAQRLFYKYGTKRVTVEEICVEANVSKMTFYKFFPNKLELAKTVLDKIFGKTFQRFSDLMDSEIPFSEKMQGIFQMKIEFSKDANWAFFIDVYKSDPELVAHVQGWIQKGLQLTVNYFVQAQEKGQMRKDINPVLLLALLDKMKDIALDDRVIAAYSNVQILLMEITKFFLYGIFDER